MNIVVDENIPFGAEAFGTVGTVRTAHGRKITREMLMDADCLIVRSITRVDASLLAGTPVCFVGACTIGEDHIDKAWLAEQGIAFASAPGCNANSVGEYVTAALLELEETLDLDLSTMTLGIVGVGNVGSAVRAKAQALGMARVLNDPPLFDATGDPVYRPIDEILECDIVTFHTPLTRGGKYPTWHMLDKEFLRWLKPGAIVINSSRGAVGDTAALEEALAAGLLRAAVLDVWENEPTPSPKLLGLTAIATPHIAGYSFDGKVNGTAQVFDALCAARGLSARWNPTPLLPAPAVPELLVDPRDSHAVTGAVRAVYDIMADDSALRECLRLPQEERGPQFDRLRKEYPVRREFFNTRIRLLSPHAPTQACLEGLGFAIA